MTDIGIRDISVSFRDNKISNISLVQGDALTRGFDITFVNAKGETLPVDDDYIVELIAVNSKDKDTPYACRHEVVDDKYRVMIPPEALSESGSVTIQLVFYQKSTKAIIHTIKQKCPVYQSIGQEFVESNNLYVDITKLRLTLEEIETLKAECEDLIIRGKTAFEDEDSRIDAENKRNLDEIIRKDNEEIRKANEIDRANNEDVRIDNESKRVTAEEQRKSNETQRIADEKIRFEQELTRRSEETERQTAELNRSEKETFILFFLTTRAEFYDGFTASLSALTTDVNAQLEEKANKVQGDWITPTLLNGATHHPTRPAQYMKDEFGFVHMRGELENVTNDVKLFDFAVGYRPSTKYIQYLVPVNTPFVKDYAKVVVAGGWGNNAFQVNVKLGVGDAASEVGISCNSISFKAER